MNEYLFNNPNNPKNIGTGQWVRYTQKAISAITLEQKENWVQDFTNMCIEFRCPDCGVHCIQYTKEDPPENYFNLKFEFEGKIYNCGLFYWICHFHNVVNLRIGKPVMSFLFACKLFLKDTSCGSH